MSLVLMVLLLVLVLLLFKLLLIDRLLLLFMLLLLFRLLLLFKLLLMVRLLWLFRLLLQKSCFCWSGGWLLMLLVRFCDVMTLRITKFPSADVRVLLVVTAGILYGSDAVF